MKTIYVLNGPNLNLLGRRQPEIYGRETLEDVERLCRETAGEGYDIRLLQSNYEGQIVDWIHEAREAAVGIAELARAIGDPLFELFERAAQFLAHPGFFADVGEGHDIAAAGHRSAVAASAGRGRRIRSR